MEGEVKEIQMELEAIRRDRQDLQNRNQSNVLQVSTCIATKYLSSI